MILTLDIPDALAERIKSRALTEGTDVNEFATAWLQDTLAADEAEALEGIRDGLDGLAHGTGRSLEDSYADMLDLLDNRAAAKSK